MAANPHGAPGHRRLHSWYGGCWPVKEAFESAPWHRHSDIRSCARPIHMGMVDVPQREEASERPRTPQSHGEPFSITRNKLAADCSIATSLARQSHCTFSACADTPWTHALRVPPCIIHIIYFGSLCTCHYKLLVDAGSRTTRRE